MQPLRGNPDFQQSIRPYVYIFSYFFTAPVANKGKYMANGLALLSNYKQCSLTYKNSLKFVTNSENKFLYAMHRN